MDSEGERAQGWSRRAKTAAAALGLVVLVAIVIQTPPFRRAVLRQVVATLADRFDIALAAESLGYDLLARRVRLTGVSISRLDSPDVPFVTASLVEMTASRSALFGAFRLDLVRVAGASLNILRRADGTTNLPSGEGGAGEPDPLPLERLQADPLAITFTDQAADLRVVLPAIAVDVGRADGAIRLLQPGTVQRGTSMLAVRELAGGVTFDGRNADVTDLALLTDDGAIEMDGRLALLVEEPSLRLAFTGSGDLRRLARWGTDADVPGGSLTFDGTVDGPFDRPRLEARVRSDTLAWQQIVASGVDVMFVADEEAIDLRSGGARVAGGTIDARGRIGIAGGDMDFEVGWAGVDLDALLQSLASQPPAVRLAGSTSGTARIRGAGSRLDAWTVDGRAQIAAPPSAPGALALPGTLAFQLASGRWRLDASHSFGGAPVRASLGGVVAGGDVVSSSIAGTVAIGETELVALAEALRTAGIADLPRDIVTDGRVAVDAVIAGTLARPLLQIVAAGRDIAIQELTGVAADVRADGTLRQMTFAAGLRHGTANTAAASGTVFIEDARLDGMVTARVEAPGLLAPQVPIGGVVDAAFDVAGPLSAPVATGTIAVEAATYDRFRLGRLVATVEATADNVHADVEWPELAARATADVALSGVRRAMVAVTATGTDLARIVRDAALPVALRGTLDLAARADVPLDDPWSGSAALDIARLQAVAGELPISVLPGARATYGDRMLDVARLEAEAGGMRLSVTGRLPATAGAAPVAPADALRALVVGDVADAIAAVRATGLDDVAALSGRGLVAFVAHVTGSAERPQLAADLDLAGGELIVSGVPPVRAVAIRGHLADGRIEPLHVSGEWQGARVIADARIPLDILRDYLPAAAADALPAGGGPATLSARVESITPAVLEPFLDPESLEQIAGAVDASLRLEAASLDAASVRGEARIDRLDVRVAGLPVTQRVPTRVVVDGGMARIAAWDWAGQGATLAVEGQVRLADGEAALTSSGRLDLRMLTPFVREAGLTLAGTLAPRVSIDGPIAAPRLAGEVALEGGEIRLRDPRIVATDLSAVAALTPRAARLTALSGVVNGGTLTGSGTLEYGGDQPATARLNTTIGGMGLELPEGLRSELDVDLSLALQDAAEGPGGMLTGTVAVLRSAYREPLAVVAGLLAAARSERLAATADSAGSIASRVAVDIDVVTENDIVVDNNVAQLALGGDLSVIGTIAAPSLAGRATVREGGQLYLGRNVYTIQSGTIDFVDPITIQPDLSIEATTRAGGYDIELAINGTPDNIEVDLSAPGAAEEPSDADIASLLLTGRTLDDLPGDERQVVGEQVLGYLSGDVLGLAGRVIGLDTLRLGGPEGLRRDPATIAAETDPTSRLTFGKSIGDDIDITYSQSLRDGAAQTWIVDYEPVRQANLRLVSDDDHLRSYEFRHDLSVGGPERARTVRPETRERDVAAVEINGGEPALREALRLGPGDRFDFSEWQRDRDRLEEALHAAGRLEARVTARREETDDGVALLYDVVAGPVTVITVTGHVLPDDVRERIATAWTQSVFDDFLEDDAAAIVSAALRDSGYLEAVARVEVSGVDPKTLAVTIEAGRQATDRRLAIQSADQAVARDAEEYAREAGLASWTTPEAVEDALTAEWRRRGFLRVTVEAGTPRVEGSRAIVPVSIDAGPQFTIGELRIEGADRLGGARVREAAALTIGEPYAPDAVDGARARVDAAYREAGFTSARAVIAPPALDAAGSGTALPIVLRVEEGPRQVLRDIAVGGQRGIDTDIIMRALDVTPGEALPANAWLEARGRLFDTGLFRRVDVSTEPLEGEVPSGDRPVRMRVTVEEWPALRLRYGFQLSEERPEGEIEGRDLTPGFSADITRRTLFGRAITLGAAAEYQRRERLGRVFLNAPTMFGLPVESLLTAQRSRQEFADATFLTDSSSIAWEQRARIGRRLQLSYAYRFERDHTFDTAVPLDPLFPVFDVTANVARLTGSAAFDTRDDPYDTRRGMLLSSSVEIAPESLGSQFTFVRQVSQAYHFAPWREVVFASAGRLGLVSPRGGQTLLPSELFYVGGARTIRGAVQDTVGPRNIFDEPAGGRALVVVNHETRFPIYRWVRGVGFFDAGSVFDAPADISLRRFTTAIGAGIRVSTPFALLRADYARLLGNEGGAVRAQWTFGIGHTF